MAVQRSTSPFALIYLAMVFLSASPYCSAEPQRHSSIPVLDLSKPPFTHNFDPDIFAPPAVTPDPLEYLERPDDLDEAIYAGRFAKELRRLERMDNDIYTNFITDGFVSDEVPRHLPKFLIRLSRKSARTGLFDHQGMGMFSSSMNGLRNSMSSSRSVSGSRRGNAASTMGVVLPAATKLLPIEKGRLVTKTTTTDFGSLFPLHSSRRGRIHENNQFKFPSQSRSFGTQNTHFTY